jgi:biotin transport system substrate-specific component
MNPRQRVFSAAGIAMTATFVGVIAAMGLVPALSLPGLNVPITIQSMGVMLAGSILGRWRGAAAVTIFLLLVALGLPLLSGGRGGLAVFFGPSVGFLLGFPVAAFVIGWLSERLSAPRSLSRCIAVNVLGGIVVLYAFGAVGVALVTNVSLGAAVVANWVFLPGDLIKAVAAAVIARGVHQALPGLLPDRPEREPSPVAA